MTGISLNDTAQRDHGVHVGIFGEELRAEGQFERPRNILDLDVQVGTSGGAERPHGAFEQGFGDLAVPLGHDDSEPHVRGRRQG